MRLLTIALAFSIALYGAPVVAEVEVEPAAELPVQAAPVERSQERRDLDARIAALQAEREGVKTRGPRTLAVVGGSAALASGALIGVVALACAEANSGTTTRCREGRAKSLEIGFGIGAGIGLLMFFAGVSGVSSGRQKQNELDGQIDELKRQRSVLPSNVEAGFRVGDETMFMIGWSF